MSNATPPLSAPEKTLRRVLVIALVDSWSLIGIAGLGLLLTLVLTDLTGAFVTLLVLAAGVLELRGHRQLRRNDPVGMRLLVRAQLLLLAVILAYCASRLGSYDSATMLANLTPDMQAMLQESGVEIGDIAPLVHLAFIVLYGTVALVTLIYQGGLALYYRSRTQLVTEALLARSNGPLA